MQEDLLAVQALWALDESIAGERKALAALARVADELAARRADEARLQKRLDDYGTRLRRTRALYDEGKVSDVATAMRQIDQCAGIVDETETDIFAVMEAIEGLEARVVDRDGALLLARAALREAEARRLAEAPGHEAALEALLPQRPGRFAKLNITDRRRYDDLWKHGRAPLARLARARTPAAAASAGSSGTTPSRGEPPLPSRARSNTAGGSEESR